MWCNVYVVLKKLVTYNIKTLNMKLLTFFGMIWNYDKFSRWNTKSNKICALSKFYISPNFVCKKTYDILGQL
jgi:hypothetical protein